MDKLLEVNQIRLCQEIQIGRQKILTLKMVRRDSSGKTSGTGASALPPGLPSAEDEGEMSRPKPLYISAVFLAKLLLLFTMIHNFGAFCSKPLTVLFNIC
jgi:hypothetical protein